MIKVVCTRHFFDQDIKFITDRLHPSVSFYYPSRTFEVESFLSSHSDVNIYFGPPPNKSHLCRNLSSLSLVQIPWSGLDSCNLLDCHRLSIPVANSHSNSSCVAEFSLALALSLIKYIPFHHHSFISNGLTHRPLSPEGFYPSKSVSDMSVGIWGFGSIGHAISNLLSSFSCQIFTCGGGDQSDSKNVHFSKSDYRFFLESVDLLFITLPLTDSTRKIFNFEAMSCLRPNSSVVNVSRGELICEKSLVKAFNEGLISNFASEFNSTLASLCKINDDLAHRIILSPHRAGFVYGQLPHLEDAIYNVNHIASSKNSSSILNLIPSCF